MAGRNPRCVFVGNIPYDATEKALVDLFSQVGPVVSFRLMTEKESGKLKGFGFCEYRDPETALSAMRNLNNVEFNGRQLRVDFAENDKGGSAAPTPSAPGKPMTIANVLEGFTVTQLYEIISQMKLLIQSNAPQARAILAASPQLSYALLHAAVLLGMIPPQALQQIVAQVQQSAPPPPPPVMAPPPAVYPMGPPPMAPVAPPPMPPVYPTNPGTGFSPPLVPPPASAPPPMHMTGFSPAPPGPAPPLAFPNPFGMSLNVTDLEAQRQLLQQLLSLTPQQIQQLPPDQRPQVQQLIQILRASLGQR